MTPRPRKYILPPNLTYDTATGRFRYRNPLDGKRTYFGRDKVEAVRKAEQANQLIDHLRVRELVGTVDSVVDNYIQHQIPHQAWSSDGTRSNHLQKVRRFKRDFTGRAFRSITREHLGEWLDRHQTGDSYMKHRYVLVKLWEYAISKGLCNVNEADCTLTRSTSKKLAVNRRTRSRMDVDQFWAIHDAAEPWLQRAMRLSLVTLQARAEIVRMKFSDARDGFLYIVRHKVAGESDMAFIRIQWNDTLEGIWRESRESREALLGNVRALDHDPCPFVIHRRPTKQRPRRDQNKENHLAITPDFLSKAFAKVRDKVIDVPNPPTFHEIRSLGGRLYREQGYATEYVQALMTHTDRKMTDVYLEGGEIEDRQFRTVGAGLEIER